MPITIVVRSASGGEAPSLTLDGERIVIGRGQGSDVRLPDPSISLRHASIRADGPSFLIVDEGSTNGTWVGGVKLSPQTPRAVKSGDLVRVGRVWLELSIGQKAATPDLGLATRDLALALVRRAMDAVGDDTCVKVHVAEGPDIGTELRLVDDGRAYVVGRAEKCDLPLADADTSRHHAAITRRHGQVLIRDMGSRNGVFVGQDRIESEHDVVWRATTMVRLGMTVLALEEPVAFALAELEAAEDEALRDEDAPKEPPPSRVDPPAPAPEVEPAPISKHVAPAAPIAVAAKVETVAAPKRRGWTMTDAFVVTLAIAVIGASIAGLVWVLR